MALNELGLPHEIKEINLFKGEHMSPEFKKINPMQGVPVLEDDGLVLSESNAILAYLGRKLKTSLWPIDPKLEAAALQWLFFESTLLIRRCGILWWSETIAPKTGMEGMTEGELVEATEDLMDTFDRIEPLLSGQRYILSNDFSLVDCSIGPVMNMLRETRLRGLSKWPGIQAYADRVRARPSWKISDGDAIYSSTWKN